MMSQVIFTVESGVKERAMRRAKEQGIPFASVLKYATRAYAEGALDFHLVQVDAPLCPDAAQELEAALADMRTGKNLSSAAKTVKEAMGILNT
ncbi:MAG: hypothetical protein RL141_733 [Candidatus Parcubacteria bacterium]|jgi:hypothetical protein